MGLPVRRWDDIAERYSVELSPRMWSRIGALDRDRFNRLRERASAIAELAAATRFLDSEPLPPVRHTFCLGEEWVVFRVEPTAQRVVVLDVVQEPSPGTGDGPSSLLE